jgi:hypothetical protein
MKEWKTSPCHTTRGEKMYIFFSFLEGHTPQMTEQAVQFVASRVPGGCGCIFSNDNQEDVVETLQDYSAFGIVDARLSGDTEAAVAAHLQSGFPVRFVIVEVTNTLRREHVSAMLRAVSGTVYDRKRNEILKFESAQTVLIVFDAGLAKYGREMLGDEAGTRLCFLADLALHVWPACRFIHDTTE